MSMHLCGPALTTISSKRRKKNLQINDKLLSEFHEYNKLMRKVGSSEKTIEEYVAYRQGRSAHKRKIVKDPLKPAVYQRPSPSIPTSDTVGNGFAKPAMAYSGERKLIGIGTMHKSNMVPIFEQSDAEDIARMRR